MRIGKLTNQQLKDIVLSKLHQKRDVLLCAGVGEDCAAVDFNGEACVLSTDPITGASKNAGTLAVHVSANDIASSGATPEAMLVTLLVPPGNELADIENVISDIIATADSIGVDIIGGHTEVTDAVNRIVVSTTAIGRINNKQLVKSSGAAPGDDIIMTKAAAIEGTYIIASEYQEKLTGVLTDEELAVAANLGAQISVVREGIIAARFGATAMHDITEGGVLGAVHELCEASGVGCRLYKEKIPVLDVTRRICEALDIDVYRLIGSGSMLITTRNTGEITDALFKNGIQSAVIGKITEKDVYLEDNGKLKKIAPPGADELFCL